MPVRLSVLITLVAVAGCAELPPDLSARSIAIYVPATPGRAASVELVPAPDNSWRRSEPAAEALETTDRIESPLTLAGDEAAVFRALVDHLTPPGGPSPDDLAVRLGPPPIADMDVPAVQIERLSRPCGLAYGAAVRPEVRPRLCPSPGARHRIWQFPLTGADLSIEEVSRALAGAGYRGLGETPINPNLHPPLPGTESLFVRTARDPVVAVGHLRHGSRPATAYSLFVLWPVS